MDPVIVVGAGPAGSSCAWKLASMGACCLLVDRAEFPREKICGGALSPRAAEHLVEHGMASEGELDGLAHASHLRMSFWDGERRVAEHRSTGPPVRLVRRMGFDAFLLERAAKAGAGIRTGCRVLSADRERRTLETSAGEKLKWSSLVCADGANGPLARAFGRKGSGTGIGLEVSLPVEEFGSIPDELQIRFGILPYGYGWVFPDAELVRVGAGVSGSPAESSEVRSALHRLLGSLGFASESCTAKGAAIPSLSVCRTLGEGDIFLAGDAAGLCDQVSGEGISHSIESGFLVAQAIAGNWSRRRLTREAARGCAGIVRQSCRYRHLLFHPWLREEALFRLERDGKFAELYWDLISGVSSYNGMFSRLLV